MLTTSSQTLHTLQHAGSLSGFPKFSFRRNFLRAIAFYESAPPWVRGPPARLWFKRWLTPEMPSAWKLTEDSRLATSKRLRFGGNGTIEPPRLFPVKFLNDGVLPMKSGRRTWPAVVLACGIVTGKQIGRAHV